MHRLNVFVDESGDEHLHVNRGASPKYVLSAICVKDEDLEEFIATANEVRRFYFQKGEIKSSKAQGVFRHKSSKAEFLVMFWITVLANCGFLAWLLHAGALRAESNAFAFGELHFFDGAQRKATKRKGASTNRAEPQLG